MTNLRKKMSFKKSFSFLKKKAKKEGADDSVVAEGEKKEGEAEEKKEETASEENKEDKKEETPEVPTEAPPGQ